MSNIRSSGISPTTSGINSPVEDLSTRKSAFLKPNLESEAHRGLPLSTSPSTIELPTPGLPTHGLPTPGLPTPGLPTPGLPTPGLPTHGLPTPGLPTLTLPTHELPTQELSISALPTPALPTPIGVCKPHPQHQQLHPLQKQRQHPFRPLSPTTSFEDMKTKMMKSYELVVRASEGANSGCDSDSGARSASVDSGDNTDDHSILQDTSMDLTISANNNNDSKGCQDMRIGQGNRITNPTLIKPNPIKPNTKADSPIQTNREILPTTPIPPTISSLPIQLTQANLPYHPSQATLPNLPSLPNVPMQGTLLNLPIEASHSNQVTQQQQSYARYLADITNRNKRFITSNLESSRGRPARIDNQNPENRNSMKRKSPAGESKPDAMVSQMIWHPQFKRRAPMEEEQVTRKRSMSALRSPAETPSMHGSILKIDVSPAKSPHQPPVSLIKRTAADTLRASNPTQHSDAESDLTARHTSGETTPPSLTTPPLTATSSTSLLTPLPLQLRISALRARVECCLVPGRVSAARAAELMCISGQLKRDVESLQLRKSETAIFRRYTNISVDG